MFGGNARLRKGSWIALLSFVVFFLAFPDFFVGPSPSHLAEFVEKREVQKRIHAHPVKRVTTKTEIPVTQSEVETQSPRIETANETQGESPTQSSGSETKKKSEPYLSDEEKALALSLKDTPKLVDIQLSFSKETFFEKRTINESMKVYQTMSEEPPTFLPRPASTDKLDPNFGGHLLPFNAARPIVGDPAACSSTSAKFTEQTDKACQLYMSDLNNWKAIRPIPGFYRGTRPNRSKFVVYFRHNNVKAMLKLHMDRLTGIRSEGMPGNSGNIQEAVRETWAYYVDRALDLRRVPPTVWVSDVPMEYLQAALTTIPNSFHVHYFNTFVEFSKKLSHLHLIREKGGRKIVSAALQLWLDGIVMFPESSLASTLDVMPQEHCETVRRRPPKECYGWVANKNEAEKTMTKKEIANMPENCPTNSRGRLRMKLVRTCHHYNITDVETWANVRVKATDDVKARLKERPRLGFVVSELMDLFMFDYIIGNVDRGTAFNVFVLETLEPKAARIVGLDQGFAFCYPQCTPFWEDNPFNRKWKRSAFSGMCRLSSTLVQKILEFAPAHGAGRPSSARRGAVKAGDRSNALSRRVESSLPEGELREFTTRPFAAMQARFDHLARHLQACLRTTGQGELFFFDAFR